MHKSSLNYHLCQKIRACFDQNQLYCCLSLCLFAISEVFQLSQIFESKEMSDYLPEEVVLQILYKLPVKSLIRFRCVSKSWNSLITSFAFIHSHLTQSLSLPSNPDKLIVKDYDYRNEVVTYKFIHDENNDYSLH